MKRKIVTFCFVGLVLISFGTAQNPPVRTAQAPAAQPANELAAAMAQRLGSDLHVKTIVGEPIKVAAVTLIPIMMIDVGFGGGAMTPPVNPSAPPQGQPAGASQNLSAAAPSKAAPAFNGFYMSGEARLLGFVAVTKKGTRFISVGKTPAK